MVSAGAKVLGSFTIGENSKIEMCIRDRVYEPIQETVLTDEKWLSFVLEQLLSNALKYTENGSVHIYKKGQILVVEDTGIGIREEDLPRIFERGFTGYNGRNDKKSTGIGLYLCKSVMDKLQHGLWLESEAGKGTRACMDLSREMCIRDSCLVYRCKRWIL